MRVCRFCPSKEVAAFGQATCKACQKRRRCEEQKKRYREDSSYGKEASRKRRAALRNEMIDAYGGECSCCHEKERAFLTLEHKNRDGKAHRAALSGGKHNTWSYSVYADLRKRGWPKDAYTVLCFNCNHATWKLGKCPHEDIVRL